MKGNRIILMRHAHRDVTNRLEDNGLSEKGRIQAEKIREVLSPKLGPEFKFFSSPKKRCQETLQPIAQYFSQEPLSLPLLNERQSNEDSKSFDKRICELRNLITHSLEPGVYCSHGDLLPELMLKLTDLHVDFGKSGWAELRHTGDQWVVESFIESASRL